MKSMPLQRCYKPVTSATVKAFTVFLVCVTLTADREWVELAGIFYPVPAVSRQTGDIFQLHGNTVTSVTFYSITVRKHNTVKSFKDVTENEKVRVMRNPVTPLLHLVTHFSNINCNNNISCYKPVTTPKCLSALALKPVFSENVTAAAASCCDRISGKNHLSHFPNLKTC